MEENREPSTWTAKVTFIHFDFRKVDFSELGPNIFVVSLGSLLVFTISAMSAYFDDVS